jgi:hypothetical protein
MKEPRQCIRCGRWFYDLIFYREGHYGCRWHDCDRINHVTRTAGWRTQPKSWWETILGVMKMKKTNLIVAVAMLLCSISTVALAQNSGIPKGAQVDRPDAPEESMHGAMAPPIGAHVLPDTPSARATPSTMPGGLYRLGNGYLNCPDTLPVMNGRPNLRSCTYVKDVH